MAPVTPTVSPREELRDVDLGDRRLNVRVGRLAAAWEAAPDRSLPEMLKTDGQLEAAYRFLNNPRVTLAKLLAPHVAATAQRARMGTAVAVLHDTTEFRFGGEQARVGLGPIAMNGQGFFGHVALAVGAGRAALGVIGLSIVVREAALNRSKPPQRPSRERTESRRWATVIRATEARIGDVHPIHVMDREADDYQLFGEMAREGWRFVVRAHTARQRKAKVASAAAATSVLDLAPTLRGFAQREVSITARAGKRGGQSEKIHPVRAHRLATLSFHAAQVELVPPTHQRRLAPLPIHVVHVAETDVPAGVEPIDWTLYTTEPISTSAEVLAVVDVYRSRWVIEEFFKALKTGCAIERRQLESKDALLNALGLSIPIAVKMLALRNLARSEPAAPASRILSRIELDALRVIAERRPLPDSPSARDALLSIAGVGGHLKRNGDPGWLVIARGFETLSTAVQVIEAERARRRR